MLGGCCIIFRHCYRTVLKKLGVLLIFLYADTMEPNNKADMATSSANTSFNSSMNRSMNVDEEHMQDSESDYKLGDNDINSSDSEWSSNDEVAINILKQNSKHKQRSSDSDSDILPLASLLPKPKSKQCEESSATESIPSQPVDQRQEAIDVVTEVIQTILANIPPRESRPRKRRRNEKGWIQNKAKTMRNSGEEYVSKKGGIKRKARELGPGCTEKCRMKCHSRVSDDQRQIVFHKFWQLGAVERQRDFIAKNVSKMQKNRNGAAKTRRSNTFCYSFAIDGKKTAVCKTFFLQTLGISAQMVETAFNKLNEAGICEPDLRGQQPSANSLREEREVIKEHIQSFPRVPSHYCRKETGKEFLESHLNIEKMYSLYKEERKNCGAESASKWVYRDVLDTQFNIFFHHRNKDQCATCTSYKNASVEEREALQEKYDEHLRERDIVFEMKEATKKEAREKETHASAVFDLEEVLTSPKLFVGDAYYLRKLNTYNFTVYKAPMRFSVIYGQNTSLQEAPMKWLLVS